MQNKTEENLNSGIRLLKEPSAILPPQAGGQLNSVADISQLGFFRDQARQSLGLSRTEVRYEYRELDSIPVKEIDELEQLRIQVKALKETSERLKFLMAEVQYLLKI
jgi:hypothetical protein